MAIVITSIALVYGLLAFIASLFLIKATQRRDHSNVMPFLILTVISIVVSCLQSLTAVGLATSLISVVFEIYILLCIYSLYDLFRNEKLGRTGQVHSQAQVVPQPHIYGQHGAQPNVYQPQPAFFAVPQIVNYQTQQYPPAQQIKSYEPPPAYAVLHLGAEQPKIIQN